MFFFKKRKPSKPEGTGLNKALFEEIVDAYRVHIMVGDPAETFFYEVSTGSLDKYILERLGYLGLYYDHQRGGLIHK